MVEVWTLKTRTCPSVNIGDTGVDLAGELRTWNARVETCEPRITSNDLRINLMMGSGWTVCMCREIREWWVEDQVVVMSDLRETW